MKPGRFRHFAAIDWSGAAGERHHGIAVALCSAGGDAPELVRPGHRWSRPEVLDWLLTELPDSSIVGFDMGISLAHADAGGFFPGWAESPATARELWALVDRVCAADTHLSASSLVDHPEAARHFRRHGGREGDLFGGGRGRFRVTERVQEAMGCRPYSNFNLVGAAQVGKSSLTGMRLLHRLEQRLPVWPIDPLPETGSVVCEIYTTIAARAAGRRTGASKIRDYADLGAALIALGSEPVAGTGAITDHAADALITAAWLRQAAHDPALWSPYGLTPEIAQTEGWTFGAA
ncbi:hypothetical protein [Novosphingobium ginsenosidimutans]|uniref:DUF429 domain-containing protein n=1 Tax=Novosphingobium ginsenosidimutans TaxID=1176536 RepID=A0A5B8S1A5_9SPHN|nr:hypothetical protein [Novosphingobium ginsenosidimutans]QEA14852.1 hypothetical protein FRF71_01180 [Novosphingobium ginsenosidimutans]